MFDPKYAQLIFSCLMALFMSCIMSLVITLYNVGLVEGIVVIWLKAGLFAFAVALPVINLVPNRAAFGEATGQAAALTPLTH